MSEKFKRVRQFNSIWYVTVAIADEPRSGSLLGTLSIGETYLVRKFPLPDTDRLIINGNMVIDGVLTKDCTKVITQAYAREVLQYQEEGK
jgi:hypothetical protein